MRYVSNKLKKAIKNAEKVFGLKSVFDLIKKKNSCKDAKDSAVARATKVYSLAIINEIIRAAPMIPLIVLCCRLLRSAILFGYF